MSNSNGDVRTFTPRAGNAASGIYQLSSLRIMGGWTASLSYDTSGKLLTVTSTFGRSLSFSYNPNGTLSQITGPAGYVVNYSYDSSGNLATAVGPAGSGERYVSQPNGLTGVITEVDDASGGLLTKITYDGQRRAIHTEGASGVDAKDFAYNSDGTTTVVNALGNNLVYGFGSYQGRLLNTSISNSGCNCTVAAAQSGYDEFGYLLYTSDFVGNYTQYTRDALGREISKTDANGNVINTTWHPTLNLPVQIDETDRTTAFEYDANGSVTKKTMTSGAASRVWTYTYSNRLLTQTNGPRTDVNDITTFTYDAQGNLTRVTNPVGHITQFTSYDAHGNVLTMVEPTGVALALTYDAAGRLATESRAGRTTSYQYDAVGQLNKVTFPDGRYLQYTYDTAQRLIQIADGLGNKTQYQLDAMGNRTQTSTVDPAGVLASSITRTFNPRSQLVNVTGSSQ